MKRQVKRNSNYTPAYHRQDPDLSQVVLLLNNSNMTKKSIANKSGVSDQCLRNWIAGRTKRPYNVTIAFVMDAMGYKRRWEKS